MISADYIRRIVDAAPPLTDEQRAVIAAQLRPSMPRAGRARELTTAGAKGRAL